MLKPFFSSAIQESELISFYFPNSMLSIIVVLGLAAYAAYISTAGQKVFGGRFLREMSEK